MTSAQAFKEKSLTRLWNALGYSRDGSAAALLSLLNAAVIWP